VAVPRLLVDVTTPYDKQDRDLFLEFSVKVFEKSFDAPGKFIIRTVDEGATGKSTRLARYD
jgi:hypothetical protein